MIPHRHRRNVPWLSIALVLASCAVLVFTLIGCAAPGPGSATNNTKVLEYMAQRDTHDPTMRVQLINGDLFKDPELKDRIVALPLVSDRDTTYVTYYEDGQERTRVETKRSPVIDSLTAAALGLNTQAYEERERMRMFYDAQVQIVKEIVTPIVDALRPVGVDYVTQRANLDINRRSADRVETHDLASSLATLRDVVNDDATWTILEQLRGTRTTNTGD